MFSFRFVSIGVSFYLERFAIWHNLQLKLEGKGFMKAREAALQVLRDVGKPLRCKEMTQQAIQQGFWNPKAKNPENSMYQSIRKDIKDNRETPFHQLERGVFGLRDEQRSSETNSTSSSDSSVPGSGKGRRSDKDRSLMTFLAAAERVLDEFGQRQPMHYVSIANKAIEEGWLVTNSKVPEATLASQIKIDTDRSRDKGISPRFMRHGKGLYGLSKWTRGSLEHQIDKHNQRIRNDLLKKVKELSPEEFEVLTGRLLTVLGFDEVEVTDLHNDGGVDVRGTLVIGDAFRTRMAVQAKRWNTNVPAKVVKEFRGALDNNEQGLIIATSNFGKGARKEAELLNRKPIGLMNGEQLVQLLVENGIGAQPSKYEIIELGDLEKDLYEGDEESS